MIFMILTICLLMGAVLLTGLLEEYPWEEKREIRQLVKQSRENERLRARHRKSYGTCGYFPPKKRKPRYLPKRACASVSAGHAYK